MAAGREQRRDGPAAGPAPGPTARPLRRLGTGRRAASRPCRPGCPARRRGGSPVNGARVIVCDNARRPRTAGAYPRGTVALRREESPALRTPPQPRAATPLPPPQPGQQPGRQSTPKAQCGAGRRRCRSPGPVPRAPRTHRASPPPQPGPDRAPGNPRSAASAPPRAPAAPRQMTRELRAASPHPPARCPPFAPRDSPGPISSVSKRSRLPWKHRDLTPPPARRPRRPRGAGWAGPAETPRGFSAVLRRPQ
ncbi:serine/arginine repetitive matrix protein 1-like [Ammospiza caudacuta]|uniref:serine/arginine repetitive matrix protein 1-like n=1 Tax=Ammospiza caudacuta TaxID=2857398 RepID=UPI00273A1C22|nr:serine/arginine repetitive matrix protein 1-like [Ammospiza caudacuta]